MPWSLVRYHESKQTHFITFSCFDRQPLLTNDQARKTFERALERVRCVYRLQVYGYVIMPEHVHLLISEPERATLSQVIKSLKQGVSRRLIRSATHFWEKRYYDFNVHDERKRIEKLRYLHRNPIVRGLCVKPEDWKWSSFLHYATGVEGIVEIESEWTARKRERENGIRRELPHSSQQKA